MKFSGVGVALVTPFDEQKNIDFPALEQLVEKVIEGGVDFLVALGTTAETPTLSTAEKKQVLQTIQAANKGRKPVVCGIGGNNTAAVIAQIKEYEAFGIDGILSVTPYYNKPNQEALYLHFSAITAATNLPIILYNVPGRTAVNMLPATTIRLAKAHQNIVAIKEACGSIPQCMELVQQAPAGFTLLSGDDNLVLAQVAVGMHGVISVAANCYPKTFSNMVHAALQGDYSSSRSLHYQMLQGIDLLFAEGNPTGVKQVLSNKNWIQNQLRLPLIPASSKLQEQLKAIPLMD